MTRAGRQGLKISKQSLQSLEGRPPGLGGASPGAAALFVCIVANCLCYEPLFHNIFSTETFLQTCLCPPHTCTPCPRGQARPASAAPGSL